MTKLARIFGLSALGSALWAGAALAQDNATVVVEEAVATVDKGDTTWMLIATILVLAMTVPGLALFYGGLVRAKNMLSVLVQVFVITCIMMVIWVFYGYSLALNGGGAFDAFIGGFSRLFLAGGDSDSTVATFSDGVEIPEYVFICFQMTFACITPALIVGGFAERMKFSALILFTILWSTFVYMPIAHMVWYGDGYLFAMGALDFAGGTVVHINAGIAALVGCLLLGKRIGYRTEPMPPHSLTLTMVGASLLWVGWFGFNAGSNLESNAITTLALINTFVATAGATLGGCSSSGPPRANRRSSGWCLARSRGSSQLRRRRAFGPMGAIVLGVVAAAVCFYFCTTSKRDGL